MKHWTIGLAAFLFSSTITFAQFQLVNAYPPAVFTAGGIVDMKDAGDGTNRVFVVEQNGYIRVFQNITNVTSSNTFLDIDDRVEPGGEMGLLGLAFHPDYQNNGYFYVNYTAGTGVTRRTVIARYQVSASNPDSADKNSELILFEFNQPYVNHNGGQIGFGPDGYLYIAVGDGGSQNDPNNNGQTLSTLLAKILRIDVDNTEDTLNYVIPTDNPFKDNVQGFKEEIYAWGFRNPWRFSFDSTTGRLWVADVGQYNWEEINLVEKGKNYGWRCREGFHANPNIAACSDTSVFIDPIHEYTHDDGCSITGGYVYRGSLVPELYGKYIYGDYCSKKIWALDYNESTQDVSNELLLTAPSSILSFGTDENNEIYVLCSNGRIYKFAPTARLLAPTNLIALYILPQLFSTLTWDDNSNIEDGFKIERKTASDSFELIDSVGSNIFTYLDFTLLDTTHYTYRVYAYSADSVSGYSNESSVLTDVPVELISFSAELDERTVNLKWLTATETNNKGFDVERYINDSWQKLGFVSGKGTTTEIQNYFFYDELGTSSFKGEIKYRLKQIDFDGTYEYSNYAVLFVDLTSADYSLEQNYPNPFNPATNIKFTIPEESIISIKIVDILGREVARLVNEIKPAGNYEFPWNASQISSGTYFAVMNSASIHSDKTFQKIIKMIYLK